ncbi:hypothetical protein [Helicobacter ganmani]
MPLTSKEQMGLEKDGSVSFDANHISIFFSLFINSIRHTNCLESNLV